MVPPAVIFSRSHPGPLPCVKTVNFTYIKFITRIRKLFYEKVLTWTQKSVIYINEHRNVLKQISLNN